MSGKFPIIDELRSRRRALDLDLDEVGRRCGLARHSLRTLVRAGAAAGISAAFRSPAGGVLMAVEVFGAKFNRDLTAISAAGGIAFLFAHARALEE